MPNIEPLVRNTVERIGDVVPLSPMAKLEIDGILTALVDAAHQRGAAEERAEAIERVKIMANKVDANAPNDYYEAHKRAVALCLAAIRATTPAADEAANTSSDTSPHERDG